jgi:cyclic pyranopterin phosphate synthase
MRPGLDDLVARLARLGPEVTLTTNGTLLTSRLTALREAGLARSP